MLSVNASLVSTNLHKTWAYLLNHYPLKNLISITKGLAPKMWSMRASYIIFIIGAADSLYLVMSESRETCTEHGKQEEITVTKPPNKI